MVFLLYEPCRYENCGHLLIQRYEDCVDRGKGKNRYLKHLQNPCLSMVGATGVVCTGTVLEVG